MSIKEELAQRKVNCPKGIKKGKLTASHRYNFTPLLRSRPGGLKGAGRTGLTQMQK
jgi:hypothetical protein